MVRQLIHTDRAPASALFSQGVRLGDHVHVSGMTGTDPRTGALAGRTVQEQTRQAIANCLAILEAGGAAHDDIVEVGVLLADPPTSPASTRSTPARSPPTHPPATWPSSASSCPGFLSPSG